MKLVRENLYPTLWEYSLNERETSLLEDFFREEQSSAETRLPT